MGSWRISQQSTTVKKKDNVPAAGGSDAMDLSDRTTTRDHRAVGQRPGHARFNTMEGSFDKRERCRWGYHWMVTTQYALLFYPTWYID
jgi:hypothetical protein